MRKAFLCDIKDAKKEFEGIVSKAGVQENRPGKFLYVKEGEDAGEFLVDLPDGESGNLIYLGRGSSASVLLGCGIKGKKARECLEETKVVMKEGSRLSFAGFWCLQEGGAGKINRSFEVGKGASLKRLEGAFGGGEMGVKTQADVSGGGECSLVDLFLSGGVYENDIGGRISGKAGKFYLQGRGVAMGHAHATVRLHAKISEGCQESDMGISARVLKEGPGCFAEVRPNLEVHTNDVVAAHGAVVKDIDPLELFYLESRGIPTRRAKNMVMRGFLEEFLGEHKQILNDSF